MILLLFLHPQLDLAQVMGGPHAFTASFKECWTIETGSPPNTNPVSGLLQNAFSWAPSR